MSRGDVDRHDFLEDSSRDLRQDWLPGSCPPRFVARCFPGFVPPRRVRCGFLIGSVERQMEPSTRRCSRIAWPAIAKDGLVPLFTGDLRENR